ncbi:MAG: GNAT family N-acetyltransferase [Chloroflexi bacterium]|nr:GNAT family N-acetyltransferase [Chloroflexota bacterium]
MTNAPIFHIEDPGYSVRKLCHPEDTESLQRLFERCADYVMIVEGQGVSPSAAQETFEDMPPGRSFDDKFVFGLLDGSGNIVGVLEGMWHYPDEATWWIGLFLLSPDVRRHGLGRKVVEGFLKYVRRNRGRSVMLGVVEENQAAYEFWQRLGFEFVRKTEPRPFGKKTQSVYVMRKVL